MKTHIDSDTLAGITAGATYVSGIMHYATMYQPLLSSIWAFIGIISGIMAIRYYFILGKKHGKN